MGLAEFNLGEVGNIFTSLREAITGEKIQDPQKVLDNLAKLETTFLETQGKIIVAEAESEHPLTSQWRPITMLVFVFIIANNYIIAPYMSALFSVEVPTLELTKDMWELIKIGLGGYVLSRGVEKSVKSWKGGNNG